MRGLPLCESKPRESELSGGRHRAERAGGEEGGETGRDVK